MLHYPSKADQISEFVANGDPASGPHSVRTVIIPHKTQSFCPFSMEKFPCSEAQRAGSSDSSSWEISQKSSMERQWSYLRQDAGSWTLKLRNRLGMWRWRMDSFKDFRLRIFALALPKPYQPLLNERSMSDFNALMGFG